MDNGKIKILNSAELTFVEKREISIEIIEIIKKNNLSLNQVNQILDLVKENLEDKPLWN